MGTIDEIVNLAIAQIGNNGKKYWNWYTDNIKPSQGYYINGERTPYCAEWISWLLGVTNTECAFFPNTVAFDSRDTHPSDRISKYALRRGDIISFDFDTPHDYGGDHVGLVLSATNERILTVEGNVGGGIIDYRNRYYDEILFGLRPKYKDGKDDGKLIIDGEFGPLTISALQKQLQKNGFYTDYIIDGDFGYYTKCELQKYLQYKGFYKDCLIDGYFGYLSVIGLQEYLHKLNYYTDDYLIDGYWGMYTTIALQRSLNDNKF